MPKKDRGERERVERDLRESEERYRRLAENAPDIIFRYELQPERAVTYVNSAVIAMLGFAPEELYDDPSVAAKMMDQYDYARMKSILKAPLAPAPVIMRLRHR